jgi:uncharacterized protein
MPSWARVQFALPVSRQVCLLINAQRSIELSRKFGFQHELIQTEELENPAYRANNSNRCFFCKDELYTSSSQSRARAASRALLTVLLLTISATFVPDGRRRRSMLCAVRLIEVGLSKSEVRELSRKATLPTWDKPASPCLSSRIAYGTTVTIERLSKIDRGEEILREFGFREFRVRHHDQLVRLEIAQSEMDARCEKKCSMSWRSDFVSWDLSM